MTKKAFCNKRKTEEIAAAVPTPFHIYDEKGIRESESGKGSFFLESGIS